MYCKQSNCNSIIKTKDSYSLFRHLIQCHKYKTQIILHIIRNNLPNNPFKKTKIVQNNASDTENDKPYNIFR